jgi:GLPGLI family protein
MKKSIIKTFLALVGLMGSSNLLEAQIKEGSITYTMTIEGLPPEQAAMMEGMEMKTIFKNGKSRSEMNSAFMNTVTVSQENGEYTVLMDGMGQKSYVKGNANDESKKKKTEEKDPVIKYEKEIKTVAGYEAKKAIVESENSKGEKNTTTVWYTDKITPVKSSGRGAQFKGLNGVPLEFEMLQGPMTIKVSATKISETPVSDDIFKVSTDGYTEADPEMMRGMGGQ